jgi:hypothetical protein
MASPLQALVRRRVEREILLHTPTVPVSNSGISECSRQFFVIRFGVFDPLRKGNMRS